MDNLSIIYYTSNYLEDHNPHFLENTKKQLLKAIGNMPLVICSQKPTMFGNNTTNVCVGEIGRSHLNIYRQIMWGCEAAKTKYVAMAEDDILYSPEHFNTQLPHSGRLLFDMNKLSIFTWTRPPLYSFRTNRRVVNQLICERELLVNALRERFARVKYLMEHDHRTEEDIIRYWGDPGRYEKLLGVTPLESEEFYCTNPSIVFSHEHAFGYESRGKRKRLGDLRITEIPYWGRAEDMLKIFYKDGNNNISNH